jgi:hypothetical protein
MSQQSMRKTMRLAASDTHRRERMEPIGFIESSSDRGPRSSSVGLRREAIGRSADIHRSPRRLRNSVLSGRFRCRGDRAATDFAVPSIVRGRLAEVSILRLSGRGIDHEQAN